MRRFQPEIEFQPREVIKKYQEQRLKEALEYLSARSPFYQRLFAENRIDIKKKSAPWKIWQLSH